MIIMISSKQEDWNGAVEERFGRTPWLIKYDTESKKWEAFQNPGASESGGAGIAAAQFVIDKGATTVISGSFGPNASNTLKAANINMFVFTPDVTSIKHAIELFEKGDLRSFA